MLSSRTSTLLLALALAGCQKEVGDPVPTNDTAAAPTRPALASGEWVQTISAGLAKGDRPTELTSSFCLSPEEVRNPAALFDMDGCTQTRFTIDAGKVRSELSCQNGRVPVVMEGTLEDGERYLVEVRAQPAGGGDPGPATTIRGRRTGPCPTPLPTERTTP